MLKRVLSWFAPHWRRVRGGLTVVFALTVLGIATRTLYPLIFKFIIDSLVQTDSAGTVDVTSARNWVLVLLAMGFLRSLTQAFLPSSRAWIRLRPGSSAVRPLRWWCCWRRHCSSSRRWFRRRDARKPARDCPGVCCDRCWS